jgi:hypothetical protein
VRIAIGADHAGFLLKEHLKATLQRLGHGVEDHGTDSEEPVDYPPICLKVARAVAEGRADRGIVLGGSGQGEQIAANKVRGTRAAPGNDSTASLAPTQRRERVDKRRRGGRAGRRNPGTLADTPFEGAIMANRPNHRGGRMKGIPQTSEFRYE